MQFRLPAPILYTFIYIDSAMLGVNPPYLSTCQSNPTQYTLRRQTHIQLCVYLIVFNNLSYDAT